MKRALGRKRPVKLNSKTKSPFVKQEKHAWLNRKVWKNFTVKHVIIAAAAVFLLLFCIFILPYIIKGVRIKHETDNLKVQLNTSIGYLKEGECDLADKCIVRAEQSVDNLQVMLDDKAWDRIIFKSIREDMDTAKTAVDIADEAIETILKPASAYIRVYGMPDFDNMSMNDLGPDMAYKVYGYCYMIDDLCPAADKIMNEINSLPEFNTGLLEKKISRYRELASQSDLLIDLLSKASSDVLRPAAATMARAPFSELKTDDGGINVTTLKAYVDLFDEISPSLLEMSDELTNSDILNGDPEKTEETLQKVDKAMNYFSMVNQYMPLVSIIVGDGEDRIFVVVAQNCSELRACGGYPGSIGTCTVEDGVLKFGDFQSIYDVYDTHRPDSFEYTDEEDILFAEDWYGRPSRIPDFTRAAQVYAALYEESNDVEVNGVISLTPQIIARLMSITGPVTLSNGVTLDETNATDYLQRQIYVDYFGGGVEGANDITDSLFAETADIVFDGVMSNLNKDSLLQLLQIISDSGKDRVFMIWAKDEESQEAIEELGVSGSLYYDPEVPAIGVFYNTTGGNKLGAYLDMQITCEPGLLNEDGSMSYRVYVKVSNNIDEDTLEIGSKNAYITSDYWGGSMNSLMYFFAPAGGSISEFQCGSDLNISFEEYNGLDVVFCNDFRIAPDQMITFTYIATTAPGVTRPPVVLTQPLIYEAPQLVSDDASV